MDASTLPKNELTEKRWNAQIAQKVLEEFSSSQMTLVAFARMRGVTVQRLCWWRKRLAEGQLPKAVAFIPAAVTSDREGARIRLRLPGEITIEAEDAAALPVAWVAALARSLAVGS